MALRRQKACSRSPVLPHLTAGRKVPVWGGGITAPDTLPVGKKPLHSGRYGLPPYRRVRVSCG